MRRSALGIPAVAYCHSNLVAMARLAAGRRFGAAAARAGASATRATSIAGFDLVLAPSRSMAAHLVDWGVARVACQPLGVDTRGLPSGARDAGWRERHGYAPATRACSSTPAASRPRSTSTSSPTRSRRLGAPYVLLAIGAGPTPPPAGERVVVLPFVASTRELATALASADAFVHAGDQETFGLSVLEAMACGTPAVVRDAEGLAELVDDGAGIARRAAARRATSPRRSPRCSTATATAQRAARRGSAPRRSDWQQRPARRCSATTCACSASRGAPRRAARRDGAAEAHAAMSASRRADAARRLHRPARRRAVDALGVRANAGRGAPRSPATRR